VESGEITSHLPNSVKPDVLASNVVRVDGDSKDFIAIEDVSVQEWRLQTYFLQRKILSCFYNTGFRDFAILGIGKLRTIGLANICTER